MNILRIDTLLLAGCASLLGVGAATAGGFDRGGVGIDLLFDPARVATEAGVTYVSPQRTINNVDREQLQMPPSFPLPDPAKLPVTPSIDVGGDYTVPRFGVKMNLFEPVDCLATYTEPYGADQKHGLNNAYSPSAVEFRVDSQDYGLTCSYKMDMGKGVARLIGGVSYQQVDAFLSRQTLLEFGNTGVGNFDLSDNALSWRVGAAYEIPEMAFRASLVYSAKYDLNLTGYVNSTAFGSVLGTGYYSQVDIYSGIDPTNAQTQIPQALELKVQSGIAPDWVAFGSVRWQQWSKLQVIKINNVPSPLQPDVNDPSVVANVSFDALYRDGWTVTGGVGHKFNEQISGLAALTWDRGTKTVIGTQTDTWTFNAGGSYTPTKNIEIRLGGTIGLLTAGESGPSGADNANNTYYSFDDDLVYAGTASLRVKF